MLNEEVAFNLMTLPSLNYSPWPGGTREPTPSKATHVAVAKPEIGDDKLLYTFCTCLQ